MRIAEFRVVQEQRLQTWRKVGLPEAAKIWRQNHPEGWKAIQDKAHKAAAIVNRTPERRIAQSEVMRRVRQSHPEMSAEGGRKAIRLHPEISMAGIRGIASWSNTEEGRKRRSEVMKRTLLLNPHIHDWKRTPEGRRILSESGKKAKKLHPEMAHENGIKVWKNRRESGIAAEHLVKMWKGSLVHREIPHLGHLHRSKLEFEVCENTYLPAYGSLLHVNVPFKRHEIDFVVGREGTQFDESDPSTWAQVMEFHPFDHDVHSSTPEVLSAYAERRIEQLRSLGIACPVLVRTKLAS